METINGLLLVFSAPSGCGKTTIVERLLKRHPDWVRSISATTRAPRVAETDGEDYFFLDSEKFQEMDSQGGFLESAKIYGNTYGTPKDYVVSQLKDDKTVLLAIDVQGMKSVIEKLRGEVPILTIFLLPPSIKVLRERLEGRKTDSDEEIEKRLRVAEEEIKQAKLFDFTVINQNLEETVLEIDQIISQNKSKKED